MAIQCVSIIFYCDDEDQPATLSRNRFDTKVFSNIGCGDACELHLPDQTLDVL